MQYHDLALIQYPAKLRAFVIRARRPNHVAQIIQPAFVQWSRRVKQKPPVFRRKMQARNPPFFLPTEAVATQTIRNNFIQPTVNAFGYTLDRLTVRWAGPPPG